MEVQKIKCAKCGKAIYQLEAFPKNLCVECHAKKNDLPPTAEELTKLWGGK